MSISLTQLQNIAHICLTIQFTSNMQCFFILLLTEFLHFTLLFFSFPYPFLSLYLHSLSQSNLSFSLFPLSCLSHFPPFFSPLTVFFLSQSPLSLCPSLLSPLLLLPPSFLTLSLSLFSFAGNLFHSFVGPFFLSFMCSHPLL